MMLFPHIQDIEPSDVRDGDVILYQAGRTMWSLWQVHEVIKRPTNPTEILMLDAQRVWVHGDWVQRPDWTTHPHLAKYCVPPRGYLLRVFGDDERGIAEDDPRYDVRGL